MTITRDRGGNAVQAGRPAITQNVTIGSSSVQSAVFTTTTQVQPFTQNTQHVRLAATSNCWVSFGSNPTANMNSNSVYLPANSPEYFYIVAGDRLAVIQDTAAGTLNITELAN